ncbi:MAG TPA: efflux RND transporter permease subunit [Anaerolineales bacterium]
MKFQFLVITIAIALMAFGVTKLRGMPVDVLPEFSPPYVEIQTEALGLSAKEVELMITVPMEQDLLAGVAWLDVVRSESVPGLSSVLAYFEPGTDLFRARQMVAERISQSAVGLPHVSKPPTMIQPLSSASRFMIVGLSSKDLSLIDMSVLARWTIAPRLMGVPGVAHVAIWGNRDRQLQVLVDPEQLQAKGVTLNQIIETTGNALWVSPLTFLEASSPGSGGFIDTPNQRLTVWHVLPISSPEELAKVPIEGSDGLFLGNVTNVVEDHQPLIGDAVINDSANLLLVVEKLPEVNTLEVTRDVEQALAALQPGLPGLEFNATLFRPTTYIEMAIANLTQSLIIAALLVVLVLGAFLYGWRTALISLVAIVVSLFAALFVLYLRGATLNSMVLAGLVIALGIVVDDAVIDVENIMRRLRQNRQEGGLRPAENVILAATAEMRSSIFFATLITLLAIVPVFFMEGMSAALFQPLAISYALAVLTAMVVALTVTPALSFMLLSKRQMSVSESPLIARLQSGYERTLERTVKSPGLASAIVIVLIVAGLVITPFLKRDQLLPSFREPYLTIKLEGASGTSHPEMSRIVSRMSSEMRDIAGVSDVGAHVGRAVYGDQVVGINSAELWISIDPKANYDSTVSAIQGTVDGYAGLVREVRTYTQQILSQPLRSSTSDDVTLRLYGEDQKVLRAEAAKLEKSLTGTSGVVNSHVILPADEPTLEIEVDLAAAQKYGIKPGEVRRTAAALLSGILVGNLFQEQKVFDVVVWGEPELRDSISDILNMPIQTSDGNQVLLKDVADIRIAASQTVIRHDAMSAYVDIGFTVQGRNASVVASDIQAKVKNYAFPFEYHAEVLSNTAVIQASQQRLLITGLIALIGIFLLLQASARSWRMAIATLLILLASLAGGVVAASLTNSSLSVAALFGLLPILGIAARNSIMLISHYQHIEIEEGKPFGPELVLRGSRERVAPTLMTALTTGLAVLPFVLTGNIPGQEIVFPMGIVILGGLVTSTLVNLFALPALYLRFGASRESELGFQRADVPAVAAYD